MRESGGTDSIFLEADRWPKPCSLELRERVVEAVESCAGCRPVAWLTTFAYRALAHTFPARDFPDGAFASAIQLFCANPINHGGSPLL